MKQVAERLFIGSLSDCNTEGFAIIHACKDPCHRDKCGQPQRGTPHYLSYEEGDHLYLNLIDPPKPLFQLDSFILFLKWAAARYTEGKPLLIHCNQGQSRAPSLALLFLAKALGKLPDTSYDAAWDAFEPLYPEYTPGTGIETFLREQWRAIPSSSPQSIPLLKSEPTPLPLPETPEQAIAFLRESPVAHFSLMCRIVDKDFNLVHPVPNPFQLRVFAAYEWCIVNDAPIRIIQIKPRQSGGSTVSCYLCYYHTRRFKLGGMMMADENDRTIKIWEMFNGYARHDLLAPYWDTEINANTEVARFNWREGDTDRSVTWEHETANDDKAGAAGTRHVLWFSESARYNKSGKAVDTKVIGNSINSLPKSPKTLIILESTAEGSSGYHFDVCQGAVTLEERMAGKLGNGWIKIFSPWHECADYRCDPEKAEDKAWFNDADERFERFRGREQLGQTLYHWTPGQIAWRRMKIISELGNDEALFDRDYPDCEAVAWQASGSPRFDLTGMAKLHEQANIGHNLAERGVLDNTESLLTWTPTAQDAWVWCAERPLVGCRYIAALDPMTGEQSAGSRKRDTHAGGIVRAAYIDTSGIYHDESLVATIDVPEGCRWDMDIYIERLARLIRWYGNCPIEVEANNSGMEAIRLLRQEGITVLKREKLDHINPGKKLEVFGFQTNAASKKLWIGALERAIREQTLHCPYKPAVSQLSTFITNDAGAGEAMNGCFDDWVTMLGMALLRIDAARPYAPPKPIRPMGPNLYRERTARVTGPGSVS